MDNFISEIYLKVKLMLSQGSLITPLIQTQI